MLINTQKIGSLIGWLHLRSFVMPMCSTYPFLPSLSTHSITSISFTALKRWF